MPHHPPEIIHHLLFGAWSAEKGKSKVRLRPGKSKVAESCIEMQWNFKGSFDSVTIDGEEGGGSKEQRLLGGGMTVTFPTFAIRNGSLLRDLAAGP